jgi:hypothetical protein
MLRVVTPPGPIVTPSDFAGGTAADDARALAVIAAVTETIDGPTGWLGRALGPQTLDYSGWFGHRHIKLPCPPVITIEGVYVADRDGIETIVDPDSYRLDDDCLVVSEGASWVWCEKHRIRYKAGYNGTSGAADGEVQTGDVPARVKQAIILASQHMLNVGTENLFLREVDIPDVETRQYTVTDQASALIEKTCDRLLGGLRVYA